MQPHSESIAKLADALCKAQAQLKAVSKDLTVKTDKYSYTYADLASVWDAVREPLTSHGLAVVQLPMGGHAGDINLVTVLMHTSGEWILSDFTMKPTRADPQGIGSCLTYARRYALSAITGVVTEDDDDGQAASAPAPQKAVQAPPERLTMPDQGNRFIWRIGKHKGKCLEDIEKGYLEWASQNVTVQDHKAAAIMELDRRNGQEIFAGSEEEEYVEEDGVK